MKKFILPFILLLCCSLAYGQSTNIALGKPARQSSDYSAGPGKTFPAGLAVDGIKSGFGQLSHTISEAGAWWEVDLGQPYDISSIKIYNATDHPQRMNDFTILVSDSPFTGNAGGATFVANETAPNPTETYAGNVTGRYVRLFLNGENYLTIHEVEVFGTPNSEMTQTFADVGTVTLHSNGDYDLKVFAGKDKKEIGKLLEDNSLPIPGAVKGTYLTFEAYDTEDNVRTEPLYLWNVDNHDYFVYAQAASDPREKAIAIGPNLHGINLTTLDPRNIVRNKQGQIFESMESSSVDYSSADGANGNYIKEGFQYNKTPGGIGSSTQKMRYKSESIKDSWSINVDLSGSVPLKGGGRVNGKLGIGYNEFNETHKNQKDIYLEKSEWKSAFQVKCDSSRADLTKEFKVTVNKLPETYNESKYKEFVDYYGTHYLTKIEYGGFYNSFISMSENTFNNLQGNALNVKTDLEISKGGNTQTATNYASNPGTGNENGLETSREVTTNSNNSQSGKLGIAYEKKHEEELTEHFQDMEGGYEYAGGSGSFGNFSVDEATAVPVIIKPQLISELLQPQVFKDDTDSEKLQKIKSNLEKYLTKYLSSLPDKQPIEAPPVAYKLEISEVKIANYKDDGDATKKADITLTAYSGPLSQLRKSEPSIDYRQGGVDKRLVREANLNPSQELNKSLSLISNNIGLVVKRGNPEKRVFKIVGKFKEYDSNFGGTPEEWIASGYINTDLTDAKPSRNGELKLTHSAVRWGSKQAFDVIIKYRLTRQKDLFDIPEGVQVTQSNQSEQIQDSELVNDPAVNTAKKITFRHKGAYIAKYSIEYFSDGTREEIHTGEVTAVSEGTYAIPADATNVKVTAEGLTGLVWAPVTVHFQQTYPKAVSRIIESHGTTLNQSYKEFDASGGLVSQGTSPPPPANEKRITLRNRGAYNASYTITYVLNKQTKTEKTGDVLAGQERTYDLPADASNVIIMAQGATGLVWEPWVTHFKQTYPKIEARIIESHGTTLNQSYKELNETGSLLSQGNTPPPPADTKRITFKNRAAYTARYTLEYTSQGKKVTENSGSLTTGRDKAFDIPRVATNIIVKAEGATGLVWEPWRKHFDKTYSTAVTKTIESHGTTLNQSAKEY